MLGGLKMEGRMMTRQIHGIAGLTEKGIILRIDQHAYYQIPCWKLRYSPTRPLTSRLAL